MTIYENLNILKMNVWQYFIGNLILTIKERLDKTQTSFSITVTLYVKYNELKTKNITCLPQNSLIETKWIRNNTKTLIIIKHYQPNIIDLVIYW